MTDKKPFWKNRILYVWSKHLDCYVANYSPSHYMLLVSGLSFDEFKDLMNMNYDVIE